MKKKIIKAWAIKCSIDALPLRAFEDRYRAIEWLEEIRKEEKREQLPCRHRLVPCTITIGGDKMIERARDDIRVGRISSRKKIMNLLKSKSPKQL